MALHNPPLVGRRSPSLSEKAIIIPKPSIAARLPSFIWWFALPTGAGVFWVLLAAFLLLPERLRNLNLVTLVASFMFSLWVLNLLYCHLRSMLVMWCLLIALSIIASPLSMNLALWPFVVVAAVTALTVFSIWGNRRAGLQLLHARRHVEQMPVAGDPFIVELQLTNRTPIVQRGLRGVDHGKFHYHRWGIPSIASGETKTTKYQVLLPRRGRYAWSNLELSSGYPFGLFRKRYFLTNNDSTVVLPRMGMLHLGKLRRLLLGPTRSMPPLRYRHARRTLAPADFCGVREFRSGDTPRYIHWRTTARAGKPMVREFEEPPLEHLLVVLDPWLPDDLPRILHNWMALRRENASIIKMVEMAANEGQSTQRLGQLDRLAQKETPLRRPLDLLEKAISLTATISHQWGQQTGTKLYLVVAEQPVDVLIRSEHGARGALPLLERLATVIGSPRIPEVDLFSALEKARLPACPIVVVSTRTDSPLPDLLAARLHRPVNLLDVSRQLVDELFTTDATADAYLG